MAVVVVVVRVQETADQALHTRLALVASVVVAMEPTQQQQRVMAQPIQVVAAAVQGTRLIQPLGWVARVAAVLWSLHSLKERSPSMRAQVRSLYRLPANSQV